MMWQTLCDAEASQACGAPSESNELDNEQGENAEHGQGESIGLERESVSKVQDGAEQLHTYSRQDSDRHGESRASRAGASRCIKAVANWQTVRTGVWGGGGSTYDHTRSKVFCEPAWDQSWG